MIMLFEYFILNSYLTFLSIKITQFMSEQII